MQEQEKNSGTNSSVTNQARRKAIKKIAVGVGVVAGYSALPEKWTKPVVGQMILPAHAETSAAAPAATSTTTTEPAPKSDGTFNSQETYTMSYASLSGGKQFCWLNHTGSYFGGPIKFVFGNGCGELSVPDAGVTHGADGNNHNYNQAFYFSGTDFQPGAAEYNGGLASVFAPPGCTANTVTVYFNK